MIAYYYNIKYIYCKINIDYHNNSIYIYIFQKLVRLIKIVFIKLLTISYSHNMSYEFN